MRQGRRRSRLRVPSLSGRLRGTATMDNKGKRDRPRSVLRPDEITIHSSRLKIYYAGRQRTRAAKRKIAAACCARTWRGGTQLPRSAPVNFYCCYFTSPRMKEKMPHGVIFVNSLVDLGTHWCLQKLLLISYKSFRGSNANWVKE